MTAKSKIKQFKGTSAPRLFFDRKIRKTGNTKSVSLGKILPQSWYYTRLEIVGREADSVTVKFTKLLEYTQNASDTTINKTGKQNT